MNNFKKKLTEKYLAHFDTLMESVANVEHKKPEIAITQKKHIDIIIKYASHLTEKAEADLMDLYSNSLFSVNKTDNYSEKHIIETTDDLLMHHKMLFEKGFLSCYESLKKNAGHIYSDDAIKKSIIVNTGARLEMAKEEFEHWAENIKEPKNEFEFDDEKNV